MILGQVSWLDILVFLIFLAPQLIIHVGIFPSLLCGLKALPFLLIKLPISFFYENFFLSRDNRSPFTQQASWFENVVIRCVRYAFAYIPASIGRVFFSKGVSWPFLRFRMLRHGYFRSPISWSEVNRVDEVVIPKSKADSGQPGFRGLWIIHDENQESDIVIYYAHGGGFSMGSSYFYLEFLLAFLTLLKDTTKFTNPAILALEYDLVPDQSYPVQLHQAIAGYKYILSLTHNSASKIVLSGDSAGATIMLSLLLHLGSPQSKKSLVSLHLPNIQSKPAMAVLISPWVTLISSSDKNTASDYLDAANLHQYALQYAGTKISAQDLLISPGKCKDKMWWQDATPSKGFFISFGAEEVFAPEIKGLIQLLKDCGIRIEWQEEAGGIHAWPVASFFLSSTRHKRIRGIEAMVKQISEHIGSSKT